MRAQIARITAATHVSPIGFYTFDEEGEEEEEGALYVCSTVVVTVNYGFVDVFPCLYLLLTLTPPARENFVVNEEFEEKPRSELLNPDLSAWVHHASHILPQGRCRWVNPSPPKEREGEEEEEEEEEPETQAEPETGPPLLQPLQNDEGALLCWGCGVGHG